MVYATLCTDNPLAIRQVRGLLDLAKRHPVPVVEQAAERVRWSTHNVYHRMKAECERLLSGKPPASAAALTQEHDLIRSLSDYEDHITERTLS